MASWMTASDGAVNGVFGWSVAVSGDTAVAGAPYATVGSNYLQGAAYVFVKPSSGWATTSAFDAKLTASDGAVNGVFGKSVAVDGDTVVAGASGAKVCSNSGLGAAYVFVKPSTGWATASAFDAKLTASDGPAGALLGYSVAVSGDTVVSGAPSATAGFNFRQGAAYVFGPCPTATTPGRHPCIEPIEPAPPVPVKGRGP